jgi:hypothetical protein
MGTAQMIDASRELESFRADLRQLHGRLKRLREFCDLLPPEPGKVMGNVIEFKPISTKAGAR